MNIKKHNEETTISQLEDKSIVVVRRIYDSDPREERPTKTIMATINPNAFASMFDAILDAVDHVQGGEE